MSTPEIELRCTPKPVEVRSAGPARRVGGYGALYNKKSRPLPGFIEIVGGRAEISSARNNSVAVPYANYKKCQ
jgi:hypothetical protein